MLIDSQNAFCNAQAITGEAVSENVVAFGNGECSFGTTIPLLIQVVEAFEGATSLEVQIQTATDKEFTEPKTIISSVMNEETLVEGSKCAITFLPKGNLGYMRLNFVPTGSPTAGKITAGVVASHDNSYQDV